jgi:hypothetical protein
MKVALVCIAKNENNYIHEWIDYHLKLGFDDVIVYKNDWNFRINRKNVHEYKIQGRGRQLFAFNTFMKKHHKQYDWAAFYDVDEFLVLKKHKNIKEFVNDYKDYESIAVNWYFFGNNGQEEIKNGDYSLLKRFTKREKVMNKHIKIITKVKKEYVFNNPHHLFNIKWVDTNYKTGNGPFNENGSDDVAQLNHYYYKTKGEFQEKISRGRASCNNPKKSLTMERYNILGRNEVDDFLARDYLYNK